MKNIIKIAFITIMLMSVFTKSVKAQEASVSNSAEINTEEVDGDLDMRSVYLKTFLSEHNSPLADYSDEFIQLADEYNLDWRLVPAISGVESTFGKNLPKGTYNAYGWANGRYAFDSWEDSIEIVSQTLREKYYDNGAEDINHIARRYAPPSTTWSWKVKYFMNKIDPVPVEFDL
jgi:hypothetical protein